MPFKAVGRERERERRNDAVPIISSWFLIRFSFKFVISPSPAVVKDINFYGVTNMWRLSNRPCVDLIEIIGMSWISKMLIISWIWPILRSPLCSFNFLNRRLALYRLKQRIIGLVKVSQIGFFNCIAKSDSKSLRYWRSIA